MYGMHSPSRYVLDVRTDLLVRRMMLALAITLPMAYDTWSTGAGRPFPSDFGQVWAAARVLLAGGNPYHAIGPQGAFHFGFPLLYPLPAAVAMLPLAWCSAQAADAIFVGVGTFALIWALTRRTLWNPQLCVVASYAFLTAQGNVQWSPVLTAAALTPGLGWLLACKPTVGLAFLTAYPSKRALISAAGFGGLTILLWPWWVPSWLAVVQGQTHILAPVTLVTAGGPLILLALLKWRRPEARLLVALACVPHTPVLYETVALFLIVDTWREGVLLSALTVLLWHLQPPCAWGLTTSEFAAWVTAGARWQVMVMYLPCLLMVLRRPNVWPATASTNQPSERCAEQLAA
jgi:hypothetical protein